MSKGPRANYIPGLTDKHYAFHRSKARKRKVLKFEANSLVYYKISAVFSREIFVLKIEKYIKIQSIVNTRMAWPDVSLLILMYILR